MSTPIWTTMSNAHKQDWLLAPELEPLWDKLEEDAPPRRGLSLGAIVTCAITLADAEGIESVSMAKIAKALGFATMAIYRHVPSKSALVVLMIDRAIGPPPLLTSAPGDWRAGMTQLAHAQEVFYRAHPWILAIPVSTPPATPNNLRWMNAMLIALRGTPLTATEKIQVIVMVISYIRGHFQLQSEGGEEDGEAGFLAAVERIARNDEFTELRNVLLPADEPGPPETEDDFAFGLNRLLDGLAVLIDQRTPTERQASLMDG